MSGKQGKNPLIYVLAGISIAALLSGGTGSFISGTPQNKRYIATFQRPCRQDFPIRFLEHRGPPPPQP